MPLATASAMTWIPSWPNTSSIPAEGRRPVLAGDTCLRRADFPRDSTSTGGLSAGILAKAVHDVGWSSFLTMLAYKAENAGRQVIKVDPKYTSQECPQCHALEKKSLSERVHRCDCGLTIGRDHAAAFVVLGRGLRLQALTVGQLAPVA
jgi:hypothetical protein